ncbi:hypothetical protein HJFPF1_10872 [Paramyrothecium foliicola]|nr:hypothetical protein HJFPF1_10872 [Paramyrothecium foliicola]
MGLSVYRQHLGTTGGSRHTRDLLFLQSLMQKELGSTTRGSFYLSVGTDNLKTIVSPNELSIPPLTTPLLFLPTTPPARTSPFNLLRLREQGVEPHNLSRDSAQDDTGYRKHRWRHCLVDDERVHSDENPRNHAPTRRKHREKLAACRRRDLHTLLDLRYRAC